MVGSRHRVCKENLLTIAGAYCEPSCQEAQAGSPEDNRAGHRGPARHRPGRRRDTRRRRPDTVRGGERHDLAGPGRVQPPGVLRCRLRQHQQRRGQLGTVDDQRPVRRHSDPDLPVRQRRDHRPADGHHGQRVARRGGAVLPADRQLGHVGIDVHHRLGERRDQHGEGDRDHRRWRTEPRLPRRRRGRAYHRPAGRERHNLAGGRGHQPRRLHRYRLRGLQHGRRQLRRMDGRRPGRRHRRLPDPLRQRHNRQPSHGHHGQRHVGQRRAGVHLHQQLGHLAGRDVPGAPGCRYQQVSCHGDHRERRTERRPPSGQPPDGRRAADRAEQPARRGRCEAELGRPGVGCGARQRRRGAVPHLRPRQRRGRGGWQRHHRDRAQPDPQQEVRAPRARGRWSRQRLHAKQQRRLHHTAKRRCATADGLTPNTEYSFTVDAFDDNGNTSARSPALPVRTGGAAGGGDPIFDRNITQLDLAWGIGFLPDGSALVAERDRFEIVRVTLNGQKTVVGRITEAVTTGGEGGLLGLAISPSFATDHFVYVFHTAASDNRLVRFKFENNTIGSREPLVTGIAKNRFHNGGRIKFGPDGFLYIATGDGQDGNRAQNLSSLNGKILRVTATGAGAPGNPFANAPRVYSLGHRNVQGLAWDSQNRLWASEFGDSNLDELNLIQPGRNYGWPNCEGPCSDSRFTNPVRTWDVAAASPSGLEIVNDWIYMAAVRGARLWVMKIQGNGTDTPRAFFNGRWGRLRTVVKTPDGGLWLTSTNNDKNGGTPTVLDNVIVRLKFAGAPFTLTSTAFASNGTIPIRYTCQQDHAAGNDISPPLSWGAGANTPQSYAITLIDTANGNKHWVIWDIPATTTSLPEGLGGGFNVPNQGPAKQKALGGTSTNTKYFGPCPGGSSHRYEFTLYAVDTATLPGVGAGSTVAQVETAILAHDLASVKLVGNSSAQA